MAPMGVPATAMDPGRIDLMNSLKGNSCKRMLKPVPRKEKKHFNMIELLKVEEKKKKGGFGVSTKSKTIETKTSVTTKTEVAKPTAQQLLAIKLKKAESSESSSVSVRPKIPTLPKGPSKCSTTEEELEALFSAIDQEITQDP